MKIIHFIERQQSDVIQRILRHCGLWQGFIRTHASSRTPPATKSQLSSAPCELAMVLAGEYLEAQFREAEAEAAREFQLFLAPEFL